MGTLWVKPGSGFIGTLEFQQVCPSALKTTNPAPKLKNLISATQKLPQRQKSCPKDKQSCPKDKKPALKIIIVHNY